MQQKQSQNQEIIVLKPQVSQRSKDISRRDHHTLMCPASFTQARFWFLEQLDPNSSVYNNPKLFKFHQPPDIDTLKQALTAIISRHEILRTKFCMLDGEVLQVISEIAILELIVIEVSNSTEVQDLIEREAYRPFNLSQDFPIRCVLFKLNEAEYILLIVMHHISSDHWSTRIFIKELVHFYKGFRTGELTPLAELPMQYGDYAVWQRQQFQEGMLNSQMAYWKNQLRGELPVLNLPNDRTRPTIPSYKGGKQSFVISQELLASLKALSVRESVTLFMTLFTAFNILLYRYTHQTDIIIGCPITNRQRLEAEKLIGCFINTIALRTNLSNHPTFRQLLQQVRTVALEGFDNANIPFEKLVEELQPHRNLNHYPIFQVLFNFISTSRIEYSPDVFSQLDFDSTRIDFDLVFAVRKISQGLKLEISYSIDLFEADTIAKMGNHFLTLLEGIITNPNQSISDLPILTELEKHQLLVEWNNTESNFPQQKCLHQLFEDQVERTPNCTAVIFEEKGLTYRELNNRANQLAHYLRSLGVNTKTLVGICVERSLDTVIGILSILKAGAAYVPLDIYYPSERLAFMLADTESPILLTHRSLLSKLPKNSAKVVCLDTDWEKISELKSQNNVISEVTSDNLAYLIYTSGSTGNPKGVQISHRSVVNFLTFMGEKLELSDQDTLLALTSISFDISVLEIFLPLSIGAKVVLMSRAASYDGRQIIAKLNGDKLTYKPTVMQATPATWQLLLQSGWMGSDRLKILCGGEALSQELSQQLYSCSGSFWNLYGPTETTIWSTISQVHSEKQKITIGSPIANTQIYLLDSKQQLVPIGVFGELYIGGEGLARGYYNQPELTKQKFISNPFTDNPKAYLYKTGDLGRYLPDGNIEFLGRIDNQTKIRGFRIELGEIEATLSQHYAVSNCVVIVREDIPNDKLIVAYVILEAYQTIQPHLTDELRSFLKLKLPNYMIPSAFIFLESFPLTPNNKIDLKALPIPNQTHELSSQNFVAPRTDSEKKLAEIWRKVLSIQSEVAIHDSFFDLGGHSLLSVQLVAEIESAFQQKIPLAALFQLSTIAELAKLLEQESNLQAFDNSTPLPLDIYQKLIAYTAGWQAKRVHPTSLVFGLNTHSKKIPLFSCGQGFGELVALAQYLGEDQPVYAMRSLHLIAKNTPENLEALSTHYCNEILAIQPEGDYLIGGTCQGSYIALEIAKKLIAKGKTVSLLWLLEHYQPSFYSGRVGLFFVRDSDVNPYKGQQNPELLWRKFYPEGFSVHMISGRHDNINAQDFIANLKIAIEQVQSHRFNWVKIRDVIVYLDEIEAILNQHSQIQKCVVLEEKDNLGRHKRLVAYVVGVKDSNLSSNELRDFLEQILPNYLIPSVFVWLDSLPVDLDDKVNRQQLLSTIAT